MNADRLRTNLETVRANIRAAAERAGRDPGEITLVAVTKYVDIDVARCLVEMGSCDLGESRPQELWRKAEALADLPVRWHLIGHLQRNKLRRTLPLVSLLHSADSRRLLDAIDAEAGEQGRAVDLLLEVKISGEASKTGLPPDEVRALVAEHASWPQLRLRGLMGMASLEGDADSNRREFAALKQLRNELQSSPTTPTDFSILSMGMSGDYELAVATGATHVRVGSSLFEGV